MTWLTVTLNNDNECYHVILCTSGKDEYCKKHCNIITILAFEKVLQLVYQYFFLLSIAIIIAFIVLQTVLLIILQTAQLFICYSWC